MKKKNVFLLVTLVLLSLNSFGAKKVPSKTTKQTKEAIMWIDGEANFVRFSHPDSIDFYMTKLKSLGFTGVIVDVRPITGEVLYESAYAPRMEEWLGSPKRSNFDYLGRFIRKGHELGMKVQATMNVFVAGHNYYDRGLVYSKHPEWTSMVYTPEKGIIPITQEKQKYSAMVNPIHPEFRKHILNIIKELATKYPGLDGIILDRARYDGISADFSDLTRAKFEEAIGEKIQNYPADIFKWVKNADGKYVPERGKYFMKWIEWRTKNIYDFFVQAKQTVKSANKNMAFGTYTGAWYPSYFEVGVNWASKKYDPSKDFDWATPAYKNYAYGDLLDFYTTGNYYTDITIEEYHKNNHSVWNETDSQAQSGTWYCVEGSCQHIKTILNGHPFVGGILADQFYSNPDKLAKSIEMNLKKSDGVMIFDIVHIITKNMWKEVEKGMTAGGALSPKK